MVPFRIRLLVIIRLAQDRFRLTLVTLGPLGWGIQNSILGVLKWDYVDEMIINGSFELC